MEKKLRIKKKGMTNQKLEKQHHWYCYLCGKEVENDFLVWSLNDRTDRVFLLCSRDNCANQLGEDTIVINPKL